MGKLAILSLDSDLGYQCTDLLHVRRKLDGMNGPAGSVNAESGSPWNPPSFIIMGHRILKV